MTNIASLEVELDLDSGQFTGTLTKAGEAVQTFGRKVDSQSASVLKMQKQMDSLTESIGSLQRMAKGFVGFEAFKEGFGSLVDAQKAMQQIQYGLQGALGSSQAAGDAYKYVAEKSQELGLNLQVTATEFTKVTAAASAMGVPMAQQKDLFDALARSQTVMHLSADQVKYSTMALAQMFGKGKIQAEELRRQLGEQIPGVVPRFQKAVMEMTKGTDLAGKSFDQLLQAGQITTDRFLPALIQALQETGRGAEEAANGLNANLNRLASEWFKLKASLSGGLFNDALTAGVKVLANNLQTLVTVATAAVGVMGARYASGFVQSGVDKAQRLMQEHKGLQMAAIAEAEYQKAQLATLATTVKETEALMLRSEKLVESGKREQTLALDIQERAAAELRAAEATLAHQRSALALASNFKAQDEAQRQVTASQNQLTAARSKYEQATRRVQTANEALLRQSQVLTVAQEEQAVATAALAAAQKEIAATGFLGTLASGVKGIGSALLGLVGGPIGLVIAGLGTVAYAFMDARSEAERLMEQTNQSAKSIEDVVKKSQALRDSFRQAGSAEPFSKLKDDAANLWSQMEANNKQLEEQRKQLDSIAQRNMGRFQLFGMTADFGPGGAMAGLATVWDDLTGKSDALIASNKKLEESTRQLMDAYSADQQEQVKAYGRAWDGVAASLSDFQLSVSGVTDWLNRASEAVKTGMQNMADIDHARAAWQSYANGILSIADNLEKKLRQKDMSAAARLQDDLNKALEEAKKGGIADPNDSDAVKAARRALAAQQALDAIAQKKKDDAKASREAAEAAKKHEDQVTSLTDRLNRQKLIDEEALQTNGKLLPAERLRASIVAQLASAHNLLTEQEKKSVMKMADELVASEKVTKQREEELKTKQALADLDERLSGQYENAKQANDAELAGIGVSEDAKARQDRILQIQREYYTNLKQMEREHKNDSQADRDAERARIEQAYSDRLLQEEEFQARKKKLEEDGVAGMKAGIQDFINSANKLGQNFRQVAVDALNQLTDKLTEFVTTGKASFKDLFTSLLKEITRVLMAKAVGKLAELMMNIFGGGGGTVTASAKGNVMTPSGPMKLPTTASANGNVMTAFGPAKLNYYEKGGIARSPQLSIFGEGRLPEAYVPLPDGRSIPVTMKGGGGGMSNTVQVNVNVDNSGAGTSDVQSDNAHARQLGEMIGVKVKETMAQEMRQGGMLWQMRYSNG